MSQIDALLYLKKKSIIEKINEVKFVGCHGGDYIFGHINGNIYSVDLVLNSHRETRFV
ncbi:MAG: hypothetical protein RBT49_06360 [Bacteroidales bacterium]|jgi:hypothetical protein|nr:hypothetical protein [Bacteroidales bacterium]